MLHSGSRNLGSIVCDNHHNIALDLCSKWFTPLPADRLAFLPIDSDQGKNYLHDMEYALSFAKENRKRMMDAVVKCATEIWPDIEVVFQSDVHHNYASLENHFGRNVYVHRKGATSARAGEIGIIPGSQGAKSYIVEGLGNMFSFSSCSHGAGRKMGRNDACKKLDLQEELNNMTGIVADSFGTRMLKIDGVETEVPDLGEASGAYKDIKAVMENQKDLVKIKAELFPIGCLKGDDSKMQRKRE